MIIFYVYGEHKITRDVYLDKLIDKNIELAFYHFNKISKEGTVDHGDTSRILSLVEDYTL